jgi:hypothetical protein
MRYIGSTTKQLWGLAFALFCLWSGLPEYLAYAEAVQQTNPTEVAQTVDKLKRLFQALAAVHDIPRETFDAKAVVEQCRAGPTKLFVGAR